MFSHQFWERPPGLEQQPHHDRFGGASPRLGHDAFSSGAWLVTLNIRNADDLDREFQTFRPDLVFHLAAQIGVRESMERPGLDAHINVVGSVNVFSAAHAAGVRRVVNTSTGGAIYFDLKK